MEDYRDDLWEKEKIIKKREDLYKRFKNFFVFDIETVPDNTMIDGISDPKVLKKIEEEGDDYFLPNHYHRIVAVSVLCVKNLKGITFKTFISENEFKLLNQFWKEFKKAHSFVKTGNSKGAVSIFPVLITINGKSFDMPVIKLRSLKYAQELEEKFFISIYLDKFDKWENSYPRYTLFHTQYHIDIPVDIFGRKISLKDMCYLCGIPVKTEGDGKLVKEYFLNGELERIGRYCSEDVKATAMLFSYINTHFLQNSYLFPSIEDISDLNSEIKVL
ncbi:hypothetical protein [Persephonella sp.]|uniref:hypothetical protein n=2 Tax=Persephonella sp. TaxID=2060922 RepID=UPI0025CDB841|nr:hypothetical protein [Persephonella sp.]